MKFVIAVCSLHEQNAAKFIKAAIDSGHEIPLIFFYQEGTRFADRIVAGTHYDWEQLSKKYEIPLAVCIGAAARRSLLDESVPDESERIRPGFDVVGLGQYIGALVEADRLITFAGSP